jgi:RNA polymerase sigma-70 factor (ECF subfamily)
LARATDPAGLAQRARDGDGDAMSTIIAVFKPLIFTVANRVLNDPDASLDITQETFIKAMMNIKKLKEPEKLKTWLCAIARNLIYDHLRRTRRQRTVPLEEADKLPGRDRTAALRKSAIIQNALARLKERDRLLLTLAYYEGMSLQEVAEVTKIAPANVKVYICRARERLREELRGYEDELLSE